MNAVIAMDAWVCLEKSFTSSTNRMTEKPILRFWKKWVLKREKPSCSAEMRAAKTDYMQDGKGLLIPRFDSIHVTNQRPGLGKKQPISLGLVL